MQGDKNLPVEYVEAEVVVAETIIQPPERPRGLLGWLQNNSSLAFWLLFAAHLLCWTIIPTLAQGNAPLDVIEGLAWGHEWPLGTFKHPPLQAWLLEAATYIFGRSGLGYFGLSALAGAITLWAVNRTGLIFTTRFNAFLAALLTEGILYLNFLCTEFNPNVLQLVLGALCTYAFVQGLARGQIKYGLMLGVFFAAGLYAKYSFGIFGISFLLFLLWRPEARRMLFSPMAYLALVAAILLCMPHLLWLTSHHFLPFAYAMERTQKAANLGAQLYMPLKFLSAQLLTMLPLLVVAGYMYWPLRRAALAPIKAALLGWIAFAPLAIALLIGFFTGHELRDMWGMPLLTFIPLWIVAGFTPHAARLGKGVGAGMIVAGVLVLAFVAQQFTPLVGAKPLRGHFAGNVLSHTVQQGWHAQFHTPLKYVIGEVWLAENIAFYGPDLKTRAHIWIDGGEETSQWIARDDVMMNGGVVVWRKFTPQPDGEMPDWARSMPGIIVQPPITLPWRIETKAAPIVVGWALLPPARIRLH